MSQFQKSVVVVPAKTRIQHFWLFFGHRLSPVLRFLIILKLALMIGYYGTDTIGCPIALWKDYTKTLNTCQIIPANYFISCIDISTGFIDPLEYLQV